MNALKAAQNANDLECTQEAISHLILYLEAKEKDRESLDETPNKPGWQVGDTVRRQAAEIADLKAEVGNMDQSFVKQAKKHNAELDEANNGWEAALATVETLRKELTVASAEFHGLRAELATARDKALEEAERAMAHCDARYLVTALKSQPAAKLHTEAEVEARVKAERDLWVDEAVAIGGTFADLLERARAAFPGVPE